MPSEIQSILDKALTGVRLTSDDCTALLESNDVARIGVAADEIRQRRHPDNVVTYIIDRNINYTNVCNVVCTFCAFYRRPGAPDTYVRTLEEICDKIDETMGAAAWHYGTDVVLAFDREVVVAGVNDHLEIWDRAAWRDHVKVLEGSAEDVAERLASQRD